MDDETDVCDIHSIDKSPPDSYQQVTMPLMEELTPLNRHFMSSFDGMYWDAVAYNMLKTTGNGSNYYSPLAPNVIDFDKSPGNYIKVQRKQSNPNSSIAKSPLKPIEITEKVNSPASQQPEPTISLEPNPTFVLPRSEAILVPPANRAFETEP